MVNDRNQYLNALLGIPWARNAKGPDKYDCYQLVVVLQRDLFGRMLPDVLAPDKTTWVTCIKMFMTHPERQNWRQVEYKPNYPINVADGSIVLLGASTQEAHIGVWLKPEGRIIHSIEPDGVTCQDIATLRALGWHKLAFYEYAPC